MQANAESTPWPGFGHSLTRPVRDFTFGPDCPNLGTASIVLGTAVLQSTTAPFRPGDPGRLESSQQVDYDPMPRLGDAPMAKTILNSPKLSSPKGIYSPGVETPAGRMVFVSGQVARNAQGEIVGKGDIQAQTRQTLENVKSVLESAGATLDDVAKVTVFVTNLEEHFAQIHQVRAGYFQRDYPASTLVEVKALAHKDLLIEIDAIAVIP